MAAPARLRASLLRKGVHVLSAKARRKASRTALLKRLFARRQHQRKSTKVSTVQQTISLSTHALTKAKDLRHRAQQLVRHWEQQGWQPACPLLSLLPAEIRDKINSFALLSRPILVTPKLVQPPILRVCRQLRNEAGPIWYTQTTFNVHIINCDARFWSRWDDHVTAIERSFQLRPRTEARGMFISGDPSWQNLKAWLYSRWLKKAKYPALNVPAFPRSGHLPTKIFFKAAHDLLNNYVDREWMIFDLMVEEMRSLALCYDNAWVL